MIDMIRLLIIEEHEAVRKALAVRLESSLTIEVVAAAKNLEDGKRVAQEYKPDVILLGLRGPKHRKAEILQSEIIEFLQRNEPVIILTSIAELTEKELLMQSGASDYLLKDINSLNLIQKIELQYEAYRTG